MSSLSQTLSIPVSGLRASATQAQAAANNIVNVQTVGYEVIEPRTISLTTASSPLHDAGGVGVQAVLSVGGNVDLATEFVRLTEAHLAYKANAKVLQSLSETQGKVIDDLA